jgi:hypothetical protein
MKKPPTPKQIIEGKEPNELTDLLEMEAPVEKAWENLKEATEKWNKEALKAMDEITLPPLYCDNCGVDVRIFPHKNCIREIPTENINETSQSVVIDEKITTKENWMDAVKEEWGYYNNGCFGSIQGTINFIEHHLLTQRKEMENEYKPFLSVTNSEGTAMLYAKDFNSATNGTLEKWMSLVEERYKSE